MRKRLLLLFLGGILTMALLNGCLTENKISKEDILAEFSDFINMFPSEQLTYLYDKEGESLGDDLGTWVVSSYAYYNENELRNSFGCNLFFNRNLREARGNFYLGTGKMGKEIEEEAYPIYYDKDGIHFVEEIEDEYVKNKFNEFKLLFDYISINKEYLSSLELEDYMYNSEVPMYRLTYKLPKDDKNIEAIKELYPELVIKEDETKLEFSGDSTLGSTTGAQDLTIVLNKESNYYLTANCSFRTSKFSQDLFDKE